MLAKRSLVGFGRPHNLSVAISGSSVGIVEMPTTTSGLKSLEVVARIAPQKMWSHSGHRMVTGLTKIVGDLSWIDIY